MNFRFMAKINSQLLMSLLQMGSIRLLVTFKYHRKDFNAFNFEITKANQSVYQKLIVYPTNSMR